MMFRLKKISRLLVLALILCQNLAFAGLSAFFDHKIFLIPGDSPYVETLLEINGEGLTYRANEAGDLVGASVEVTIIIRQGSAVIDFEKFALNSPLWPADSQKDSFMDIRRFKLANGQYTFDIKLSDLFDPSGESVELSQDFSIDVLPELPFISDVLLIKAYSKTETPGELTRSGFDILPYVDNFFPAVITQLAFYTELYNANKAFGDDQKFITTYYVEDVKSSKVILGLQKYTRSDAKEVNPTLEVLNIAELPSGEYELVIEMRSRENETVASRRIKFFRQNTTMDEIKPEDLNKLDIANTFVMQFTDRDVLEEHINSLHPITSNVERSTIEYQLKEADLTLLKQFFYSFWERRSPENPEAAWNKYLEEVKKVQANYSTRIKKGYETDRGRVYLQYGPPNTQVLRHNDTDAYPYEIWHYYQAGKFRNKRFVFYNPDLVSNDFELLQSDLPGEIKNDRWVMMILQRNNSLGNQEQRTIDNGASRVLIDLYNNPR